MPSTADLALGEEIDVVVKLEPVTRVRARVVWRSAEWFIATSDRAVHRGRVSGLLGNAGEAFCEYFQADLDDLEAVLAYARSNLAHAIESPVDFAARFEAKHGAKAVLASRFRDRDDQIIAFCEARIRDAGGADVGAAAAPILDELLAALKAGR